MNSVAIVDFGLYIIIVDNLRGRSQHDSQFLLIYLKGSEVLGRTHWHRVFYYCKLNIYYGSRLLALLNNRYHNMETAVCAYNAGVGNVDSWLKNSEYSQDGATLSTIPYEETRVYRIKIFLVKRIYEVLYDFS